MKHFFLGLAALAGGLYFWMGKAFAGPLGMPAHSEPDAPNLKRLSPVRTTATASSGRQYTVWMYPPDPTVGVYTVAKLIGGPGAKASGQAWLAFFYNVNNPAATQRIPVKTNATELGLPVADALALTNLLKADWNM